MSKHFKLTFSKKKMKWQIEEREITRSKNHDF